MGNTCNSGSQLAILSSLIAALIAQELTVDEQNVLGNFIVSVGSSLLTIAAQNASQTSQQAVVQLDNNSSSLARQLLSKFVE